MKKTVIAIFLMLCILNPIKAVYGQDQNDIYKQLGLTEEEIRYLQNNKTFSYAIANKYPPIEYMSSDSKPKGIGVEYLNKASELLGIQFILYEEAEKLSWNESLGLIRDKKIDVLPAASYTEKRSEYMLFTKSYFTEDIVVIGHKGRDVILTEKDFEGKRLVFTQGHWQNDYIRNILDNPQIINMSNTESTLRSIEMGSADYTFIDNIVYIYYLQKKQL